jgi:hypothetical protein
MDANKNEKYSQKITILNTTYIYEWDWAARNINSASQCMKTYWNGQFLKEVCAYDLLVHH